MSLLPEHIKSIETAFNETEVGKKGDIESLFIVLVRELGETVKSSEIEQELKQLLDKRRADRLDVLSERYFQGEEKQAYVEIKPVLLKKMKEKQHII